MRGTAPLLVAAISVLFLGDRLSPLAWLGIGVICLAILAMAFHGSVSSRKGIVLASSTPALSRDIHWWTAPASGWRARR